MIRAIGFGLASLLAGTALDAQQPSPLGGCSAPATATGAKEFERRSVYVPAADGTRLAVDYSLPKKLSGRTRLPTVFSATRYWRGKRGEGIGPDERFWLERGYAVVRADVRGTGASFGQWYLPWSPQEVKDVGLLVGWIAQQRWSNGKVGAIGTSYLANTAQLAAAYGGPALKAVIPRFMDFDMYTDLLFPGGVIGEHLITQWGRMVRALDLNHDSDQSSSVRPVDQERNEASLKAAIEDHRKNPASFDGIASQVTFRNELLPQYGGYPIDISGAYRHAVQIEGSGVPIFGWAGWFDAGTAQGALNRFMNWRNPQLLVIGPWSHGARFDANPFAPVDQAVSPTRPVQEEQAACFFDQHLNGKSNGMAQHAVIYYTMVEDKWKKTSSWPVPGTRQERFYFHEDNHLAKSVPAWAAQDNYRVDFEVTTGTHNRWYTQTGAGDVIYPDRAAMDQRWLVYTSAPLADDLEVTGQPVVNLGVASTATDGNFLVYLEDLAPDGTVTYVTEGMLRALHRKVSTGPMPYKTVYPAHSFNSEDGQALVPGKVATLTFQLLPTSVLFKAGHRIRVAIAGADQGSFSRIPAQGDVTITVWRGGPSASFIDLPVIPKE